MNLNPITNNVNFSARIDLVEPKNLVNFLESYPDFTIRARMMQDMLDTITLTKTAAPSVGTQSDVLRFKFGKDDFVRVHYNDEEKGALIIRENPLLAVANMMESLTEGKITKGESLKPFKLWQGFSYLQEEGVLQRTLYRQKGNGRFTIAKVQKTTMEELTQRLKQLLGIS